MLKSKGTLIGIAAALVVSMVIAASFAAGVTSGAGTDAVSTATPTTAAATPTTAPVATPTAAPANPPASNIEQPVGGTNPDGSQLGANAGTSGLPNTGYGAAKDNGSIAVLFMVLGLAGASLAGAGAMIASKRSR